MLLPIFEGSFIVETDASSGSLGSVLARKKEDGRIRPVQYAIRTITPAERSYSACEREALAVVVAPKKFRVYMPSSKPVSLITDYQEPQYALEKKDVYGRQARLLDFLAEYEFKIEYRPGQQNGAVYYLSRIQHQCENSVEKEIPEDNGELSCAIPEAAPDFSQYELFHADTARYLEGNEMEVTEKRLQFAIRRSAKNFMVWEGKLLRRTPHGLRVIPPKEDRLSILRTFHDEVDIGTSRGQKD